MVQNAVHFGAGSIGRGFLGQLYFESGFHTIFIDVADYIVNAINTLGEYPIDIISAEGAHRIPVRNISAVNGKNSDAAARTLAKADIASTAVGLHALPHIVPIIARGVALRFSDADAPPLDIMLCENLKDGEQYMRGLVKQQLAPEYHSCLDERVGFVEASIGRMAPVMTPEQQVQTPLLVCVEPYCDLPVDAAGFKGAVPKISHLQPTKNFVAYVERKLYVHNLTHAATAYLGCLRGHAYICDAIRDESVRKVVEQAGLESCAALAARRGLDQNALEAHRVDLIERYHNRGLADQIARVGRDPIRKLSPNDRLVGAASMCVEQQITPDAISVATAAAMLYHMPDDPTAQALHTLLRQGGPESVMREVCRLDPDTSPGNLIIAAYHRLQNTQGK